jgi:hypothetical protein
MLDQEDLDRDAFFRLVQRYHLDKLLDYFAQIAQDLFGRLPYIIQDYQCKDKTPHHLINCDLILNGSLPYSKSRARILLPMYYMARPLARIKFLWIQLFPPMDTIRDFYVDEGSRKSIWNYVKLRSIAIKDLIAGVHKEE